MELCAWVAIRNVLPSCEGRSSLLFYGASWMLLESAEISTVSNLLLTRVAGGTRRQQPFYHPLGPLGDFLADRSNFGTIAKFAITPEAARNIGISASGSAEKAVLSKMLAKQPTRGEEQHRLELCCICNLTGWHGSLK